MLTERYSHNKAEWDEFIRQSKNGTFLLERDYMDYHSDRFQDYSLMFRDDRQRLVAVLPANIVGDTLYSHQGLTYGGLITSQRMQAEQVLEAFVSLRDFLAANGIKKVIYKPTPHIYHTIPAEEDLYALFKVFGARLTARSLSSVVDRKAPIPLSENRRRNMKKAINAGITVSECTDYSVFWPILEQNLRTVHNQKPVHTVEEITRLASAMNGRIRLFIAHAADGTPLAGTVLFLMRGLIHSQYISASDEGKRLHALDLLFKRLIDDGILSTEEYPLFDFGISTEQGGTILNEGLIHQKEGFGGRGVCYDCYEFTIE